MASTLHRFLAALFWPPSVPHLCGKRRHPSARPPKGRRAMKIRAESWGAWVRLESPPALVAIDHEGLALLQLPKGAPSDAPLEAHVAVTERCGIGCSGCYLDAVADGHEPTQEELLCRLDALAGAGAFTVAFGGGEPLLRADLGALAQHARSLGMWPVLTTSGVGLTEARARELRHFAQVNVSYDGASAVYASVRGVSGASHAERAIALLAAAGVRVGANVVLTKASFAHVGATVARVRSLGASEAQLLRYKPAGRARSLDYLEKRLGVDEVASLGDVLRQLVEAHAPGLSIRIDCALVPLLSMSGVAAADLVRFGVFGCEAGEALLAVTARGIRAGCSFAPTSGMTETLESWGTYKKSLPDPCASCPMRAVCKGGCQIVSTHTLRRFAPDPECPRVIAHHAASHARPSRTDAPSHA